MALEEYRRKRRFGVTTEPKGAAKPRKRSKKLRFVVQKHRAEPSALRFSPRMGRGAALVGGAEGPVARSEREAARDGRRGPPARVRQVRGRDPGRRVRRRHGDGVGSGHLDARRARRREEPRQARRDQVRARTARSSPARGCWCGRAATKAARAGCSSSTATRPPRRSTSRRGAALGRERPPARRDRVRGGRRRASGRRAPIPRRRSRRR